MLGAGDSTRFGLPVKKQWLRIGSDPLWLAATKNLNEFYTFKDVIVVSKEHEYMTRFAPQFKFARGGNTRQDSLKNALSLVNSEFVLVSDIARPCISRELFNKIIDASKLADCVVPALKVADTAYLGDEPVNRDKLKLIQTPQLSRTDLLKKALQTSKIYTDESSAMRAVKASVWHVLGDERAHKITNFNDLKKLSCLTPPSSEQFTGIGFDVHKFSESKTGSFVTLCGENIPHERSLIAHSDGDVSAHALTDAILGAAGLGDIGEHFPDTDAKFRGANSLELLSAAYALAQSVGFELINADISILAERPKISKFKRKMEANVAQALGVGASRVNVKATTTEKLGFVGREEGIAALASVNLRYYDWTKK